MLRARLTSPLGLFAIICVISVGTLVAAALVTAGALRDAITRDALDSAEREARTFGDLTLEAEHFADGHLTAGGRQDLEQALESADNVYGGAVWTAKLKPEFTFRGGANPARHGPTEELESAFDGKTTSDVEDTRIHKPGDREHGERVISAYFPVVSEDTRTIAVLETHLSYGPTRREISRRTERVYILLAVAGGLLLLALIPSILRGSRSLSAFYRARNRPLQRRLRAAIRRGELELHYQPKMDLATGQVTAVEALLRWRDPKRGLLPPAEFLPQAEATPVMHPLTMHVVELAARQTAAWRDEGLDLEVAVNLSPVALADRELPERIADCLSAAGLGPTSMALELTETAAMELPDEDVLRRLQAKGFRLSIDDFGTGRSSLSRLNRLPLGELKIDREFVVPLHDGDSTPLVTTMLALAQEMGLDTVAEGVESEQAAARLRDLGCDFAQGFYLTRPLPPDELSEWLRDARAAATR